MEEVEIIKMVPHVVRSMQRRIWIDYDEDADCAIHEFYIPAKGCGTRENTIIRNYDEKGNLTGLTIIAAKRFLKAKEEEWSDDLILNV